MENENKELTVAQNFDAEVDKSDFSLEAMPSFNQAMRMSKLFVASGKITDIRSMAEMATKLVIGGQLGILPPQALQSIYFVNGKPAVMTSVQLAKVQEKGFQWRELEGNRDRCVLEWFNPNGERLGQSSFDREDARVAGLLGSNVWQKYPADMLFNRAALRGIRKFCPSVFGGTIYDPEELRAAGMSDKSIERINAPEVSQSDKLAESLKTTMAQIPATPIIATVVEPKAEVKRGRKPKAEIMEEPKSAGDYEITGTDSVFYARKLRELGDLESLEKLKHQQALLEGLTDDDKANLEKFIEELKAL